MHYAIVVVCDSPTEESVEEALKNFEIFEASGNKCDNVTEVDVTEVAAKELAEYSEKNPETPIHQALQILGYGFVRKSGEVLELEGKHKYGHVELNDDETILRVVRRTNPLGLWDGYSSVSHWGVSAVEWLATGNVAVRAGDIDINAICRRRAEELGEFWDKIRKKLGDAGIDANWTKLEQFGQDGYKQWLSQPAVMAIGHIPAIRYRDDLMLSREEFAESRKWDNLAFAGYVDGPCVCVDDLFDGTKRIESGEKFKVDWPAFWGGLDPSKYVCVVDIHR